MLSILVTTKPAFCRSAEALAARPVRLVELSTANEGPAGVPAPVGAAVTLGAGVQVGAGEADWLSARWMTLHHTKVVSRERTSREINAGIGRRDARRLTCAAGPTTFRRPLRHAVSLQASSLRAA